MIVVRDELLATFDDHPGLSGNELIALMAYGIVVCCQENPGWTAAQISEHVFERFPMVELELAVLAFETALDAVTDARFVAYIPSKGVYRGTVAGKLIAVIGTDLSTSGALVGVQRFLHWARNFDEVNAELATEAKKKAEKAKQSMEKVKEQVKHLLEKETLQ